MQPHIKRIGDLNLDPANEDQGSRAWREFFLCATFQELLAQNLNGVVQVLFQRLPNRG